jgi:hypothetical protein
VSREAALREAVKVRCPHLREAMAWHRGGWHRWRWRRRGVGVDGGDDDIEGGGGKSGSLTAQNQIFTMS